MNISDRISINNFLNRRTIYLSYFSRIICSFKRRELFQFSFTNFAKSRMLGTRERYHQQSQRGDSYGGIHFPGIASALISSIIRREITVILVVSNPFQFCLTRAPYPALLLVTIFQNDGSTLNFPLQASFRLAEWLFNHRWFNTLLPPRLCILRALLTFHPPSSFNAKLNHWDRFNVMFVRLYTVGPRKKGLFQACFLRHWTGSVIISFSSNRSNKSLWNY